MAEAEHKGFSEHEVQQRFEAIAKGMVEAGLYAEAIEAYKELLRDYPGSRWAANACLAIAHCYHAMGQEQEELQALEDIIAQFPDHVVAKRAQGAIAALRERHYGEGAGADLHGALRRLTRQVERMRQGQQRRAWVGAMMYLALVAVVAWIALTALHPTPSRGLEELDKRIIALEAAVDTISGGPTAAVPGASPQAPAPSVTVTPIEPEPQPTPAALPPAPVEPKPKPTPAKPKPAPPLPVSETRTYVVKEGDSLWTIASRELGDGRKHEEIAQLNGLTSPYKIKVGDKLKLPVRR